MSFYKNTRTNIIRITPEITAQQLFSVDRKRLAIPIGSICSWNAGDFDSFTGGISQPTIYLECCKAGEMGGCTGCYFRFMNSSFCPVCSISDRGEDVIFKKVKI